MDRGEERETEREVEAGIDDLEVLLVVRGEREAGDLVEEELSCEEEW